MSPGQTRGGEEGSLGLGIGLESGEELIWISPSFLEEPVTGGRGVARGAGHSAERLWDDLPGLGRGRYGDVRVGAALRGNQCYSIGISVPGQASCAKSPQCLSPPMHAHLTGTIVTGTGCGDHTWAGRSPAGRRCQQDWLVCWQSVAASPLPAFSLPAGHPAIWSPCSLLS